jgi:hypothetical protein
LHTEKENEMADIRQAARWMDEEKSVRRRDWSSLVRISIHLGLLKIMLTYADSEESLAAWFSLEDLLADDWEIAE